MDCHSEVALAGQVPPAKMRLEKRLAHSGSAAELCSAWHSREPSGELTVEQNQSGHCAEEVLHSFGLQWGVGGFWCFGARSRTFLLLLFLVSCDLLLPPRTRPVGSQFLGESIRPSLEARPPRAGGGISCTCRGGLAGRRGEAQPSEPLRCRGGVVTQREATGLHRPSTSSQPVLFLITTRSPLEPGRQPSRRSRPERPDSGGASGLRCAGTVQGSGQEHPWLRVRLAAGKGAAGRGRSAAARQQGARAPPRATRAPPPGPERAPPHAHRGPSGCSPAGPGAHGGAARLRSPGSLPSPFWLRFSAGVSTRNKAAGGGGPGARVESGGNIRTAPLAESGQRPSKSSFPYLAAAPQMPSRGPESPSAARRFPAEGARAGNAPPAGRARPWGKRERAAQCLPRYGSPSLSGAAAVASTGRAARRAMLRATLLLLLLLLRGGRGERGRRRGRDGRGEGGAVPARCPPRRGRGAGAEPPALVAGEPHPAAPVQVRFLAETFRHVLLWEPGAGAPPEARYDVQYKRYGHAGWTAASHCAGTASHSCDLTPQTLSPQQRYYARVRAVTGNRTSRWTPTLVPLSPKEAILRLASVSAAVTGNRIHMTLQLPVNRWGNVTCKDVHGLWLEYHVCIQRASDGHRFVYVSTSLEFDLPPLLWGEKYCVSVEPRVVSQPTPGKRTEEQCLSIPLEEADRARTILLPSFTLLCLVALGILGMAWTWVYVKKPTKTPSVLQSFLRTSSPWGPSGLPALGKKDVVFCVEAEFVQFLSLSPKNRTTPDVLSHPSAGAAAPPLEESCWLPTLWAGSELKSLGLPGMQDSSGCSVDSGICLQEASGSLSHFLDCRGPFLGSSEEGEGVQESCGGLCVETGQGLQPVLFSEKTEELALEADRRQEPADPPQALFSGYQKQSGSSKTLSSTGEMAYSHPSLPNGYLKQPSFVVSSDLGDVTRTQDVSSRTQLFAAVAPCVLWSLDSPPECPKTSLPGSFLEPPVSPHLSLWHLSRQLSLDLGLPQCRV
ncbi:interleukin-10 receptor subunit alpha [Tiliqua scincoides]|uniref:interleukin-10 receptor subunit alpha n=1 Tax=Tiliqua scincoides TaxID=71010 RepID=UPI003461E840